MPPVSGRGVESLQVRQAREHHANTTERLAKRFPRNARGDADNYAMYTNANWFAFYFEACDVPISSNGFLLTGSEIDPNDIPFLGAMNTYTFEDANIAGSSDFTPTGNPEDDADQIALDDTIVPFTTPDGTVYSASISGENLQILPLGNMLVCGLLVSVYLLFLTSLFKTLDSITQ
jgi:hypothetical protein